jgi:prolyl-tRNA synthetase
MDRTTSILSKASIAPHSVVSHDASTSPAAWRSSLSNSKPSAPESYQLTKTLVFKPKTAKNATPVPLVVVLREETEMNSAALGKKLQLKDLRLASEELLQEFFKLDKDSRTQPSHFPLLISFRPVVK